MSKPVQKIQESLWLVVSHMGPRPVLRAGLSSWPEPSATPSTPDSTATGEAETGGRCNGLETGAPAAR